MKVVVFDSGEGCKFVAKQLKKEFSAWKIIVYEDRENFPYGKKSKSELRKVIQQSIDKIYSYYKPNAILVASYTPSLQVFQYLKSKCRLFKMILPFEANTIILVTDGLAKSAAYIRKTRGKKIITIPISGLAKLIQDHENKEKIRVEIKRISKYFNTKKIVLGCTHLPSVLPIFQKVNPELIFIDPVDKLIQSFKKFK